MTRSRPVRTLVALVSAAFILAACAEPTTTPPPPAATPSPSPEVTPSATAEASSAPTATESAGLSTEEVTVEGSQFVPGELTSAAGTLVTFVNLDSFAHTVTEGSGGQAADDPAADEMLEAESSVEVTFDESGTYEITCRFHPTMQMTIVVEGA
jgi:plastocyanin